MSKISMMIAAMAAAVLISGCGKDNGNDNPVEIKDSSYTGTMKVVQTDGSVFEQTGVKVGVTFNDDNTLKLVMYGVKFSEKMPLTLDMTVEGINWQASSTAGYVLSGDNLIPEAMGGPFPDYVITGFKGTVDSSKLAFDLTCGGLYPLSFSGTCL